MNKPLVFDHDMLSAVEVAAWRWERSGDMSDEAMAVSLRKAATLIRVLIPPADSR